MRRQACDVSVAIIILYDDWLLWYIFLYPRQYSLCERTFENACKHVEESMTVFVSIEDGYLRSSRFHCIQSHVKLDTCMLKQ